MDMLETIATRRSIKKYTDAPVEDEKLRRIAEAALWAPSGQNLQPVRLWVLRDRELIERVERGIYAFGSTVKKLRPLLKLFRSDLRGEKAKKVFKSLRETLFNGAPVVMMVGADMRDSYTCRTDCILAAMNIQLAAYDLGLGSCYIGWAALVNRIAALRRELKIPPHVEIVSAVVIGYTDSTRKAPARKPVDDVTTWL